MSTLSPNQEEDIGQDVKQPTKEEIIAQIEGYLNDFEEPDEVLGVQVEPEADDDNTCKVTGVSDQLREAQLAQVALVEENQLLLKKAQSYLEKRKGGQLIEKDVSRIDQSEQRYRLALKQWDEFRQIKETTIRQQEAALFQLNQDYQGKLQRAQDIMKAFRKFKVEVVQFAHYPKTGKSIPKRQINELEQQDQEKEIDLQSARLRTLQITLKYKKLEKNVKSKEQLANGLHLIDFEQLKIENQSLNEKIEERHEELLRLQKKTTATLQVLTHIKEKLQFVAKENDGLQKKLEAIEQQLADKRDTLSKVKAQRDQMRIHIRKLKDQSVYISNVMLIKDMDLQREKREQLKFEVKELAQNYQSSLSTLKNNKQNIKSLIEQLNNPTSSIFDPAKAKQISQSIQK